MEANDRLGTSLRLARQDARKTLTAIRKQTGLSAAYLSQLEAGQIAKPGVDKLALLAPVYGLSYDLLLVLAHHTPRDEAYERRDHVLGRHARRQDYRHDSWRGGLGAGTPPFLVTRLLFARMPLLSSADCFAS